MSDFRFELTDEEKSYLKELVIQSISFGLNPGDASDTPPEPPTDKLKEHLGAFVTLKLGGNLRGCIGNVQGSGELFRTVWNMARSAAFETPVSRRYTKTNSKPLTTKSPFSAPSTSARTRNWSKSDDTVSSCPVKAAPACSCRRFLWNGSGIGKLSWPRPA